MYWRQFHVLKCLLLCFTTILNSQLNNTMWIKDISHAIVNSMMIFLWIHIPPSLIFIKYCLRTKKSILNFYTYFHPFLFRVYSSCLKAKLQLCVSQKIQVLFRYVFTGNTKIVVFEFSKFDVVHLFVNILVITIVPNRLINSSINGFHS